MIGYPSMPRDWSEPLSSNIAMGIIMNGGCWDIQLYSQQQPFSWIILNNCLHLFFVCFTQLSSLTDQWLHIQSVLSHCIKPTSMIYIARSEKGSQSEPIYDDCSLYNHIAELWSRWVTASWILTLLLSSNRELLTWWKRIIEKLWSSPLTSWPSRKSLEVTSLDFVLIRSQDVEEPAPVPAPACGRKLLAKTSRPTRKRRMFLLTL